MAEQDKKDQGSVPGSAARNSRVNESAARHLKNAFSPLHDWDRNFKLKEPDMLCVAQGEAVITDAANPDVAWLGTPALSTCIGLALYEPGSGGIPATAAVAHVDAITRLDSSIRDLVTRFPRKERISVSLFSSKAGDDFVQEVISVFERSDAPLTLRLHVRPDACLKIRIEDGMVDPVASYYTYPNQHSYPLMLKQKERIASYEASGQDIDLKVRDLRERKKD
jgi:hypothetical protein